LKEKEKIFRQVKAYLIRDLDFNEKEVEEFLKRIMKQCTINQFQGKEEEKIEINLKERIIKRYKLIVDEYNSRGLGWFWSKHILDKLIKDDWCSEAGGKWITSEGKHVCVDIKDYDKVPKNIRIEVEKGKLVNDANNSRW